MDDGEGCTSAMAVEGWGEWRVGIFPTLPPYTDLQSSPTRVTVQGESGSRVARTFEQMLERLAMRMAAPLLTLTL